MSIEHLYPWKWFNPKSSTTNAGIPLQLSTAGLDKVNTPDRRYELAPFNQLQRSVDALVQDQHAQSPLASKRLQTNEYAVDTRASDMTFGIGPDRARYLIAVEVPGYEKSDIAVDVDGDTLTLRGTRLIMRKHDRNEFKRVERHKCAFKHTVVMPDDADTLAMKAQLKSGVLNLQVPRRSKVREGTKRVTIH
ncbi:MAG: Hsp20/alpha crystallin family protein [Pseudomonadota bacterium]